MPTQDQTTTTTRRGVIAVIQRDDRFLVIRRSRFVRAPRKFCFPGGEIELGENEETALKREIIEELNVVPRPIERVWTCETKSGVALAWWHADIGNQRIRISPAEVEAFYWLRIDDILAQKDLLDTNRQFMLRFREGTIRFG